MAREREERKSGRAQMKTDVKLTSFFMKYAARHRKRYLIAMAIMPACAGLSVLGPILVKHAIDEGVASRDLRLVTILAFAYLGVVIVNFILTAVQMLLMQTAGVRTLADLRAALLTHISFLPRGIFEKRPVGIFVNRTTSDVETIGETIATGLTNLITDVLTITAIFFVIFHQNRTLGFITFFLLPVIVLIVDFFRKRLRFHHDNIRTIHGKLMAQLHETCSMLFEVNNFHLAESLRKSFQKHNDDYMKESVKAVSYDALIYSVLEGLSFLVIGVVFLFISGSWLHAAITIGQLIMYLQLLDVLFTPVKQMGQRFATIQSAFSALEKVNDIFLLPVVEQARGEKVRQGGIAFENVSFAYQANKPVLRAVNFQIPEGKSLAIVGPTGSGKTTIARLLSRQYEPDSGRILLGNQPMADIARSSLKGYLALVQQEPVLLRDSVAFNIGLGNPALSIEEIQNIARSVLADTFIKNLPQGYDTIIERGGLLSAGQKQLIALARVLASGAKILIFDEATANIDTQTELLLQRAIDYVMTQRTLIVIAHRLSTIKHVHHILVLKNGRIVEEGNHDSLLAQNGLYSRMYELQSLSTLPSADEEGKP